MIINPIELESLFQANYRNRQTKENGFTDAEFILVDDLCFEDTMEMAYEQKDRYLHLF